MKRLSAKGRNLVKGLVKALFVGLLLLALWGLLAGMTSLGRLVGEVDRLKERIADLNNLKMRAEKHVKQLEEERNSGGANIQTGNSVKNIPEFYLERAKKVKDVCEKRKEGIHRSYFDVWGEGVRWETAANNVLDKNSNVDQEWRHSENLLVDRINNFFWCKVPKAASTSWVTLFVRGRRKLEKYSYIGQQHLYLMYQAMPTFKSEQELNKLNTTMFSFLTVRHPFERLLSAYRDKFFVDNSKNQTLDIRRREENKAKNFYEWYGKDIIEKYRRQEPREDKYEKAPRFGEFVEFLVDLKVGEFNSHWVPYYLQCMMCHFRYDVIATTETLARDSETILRHVDKLARTRKHDEESRPDSVGQTHITNGKKTTDVTQAYFAELSPDLVRKLYKVYQVDFEMFEYSIEPYLSYAKLPLIIKSNQYH